MDQTIGTPLPDQHAGLHQGAHALLQKEGIALRAGNQELVRAPRPGSCPSSAWSKVSALASGRGIEPQLRIMRFTAPTVLILGTVIDQEEDPRGRQALNQQIEHRLRLRVDPV